MSKGDFRVWLARMLVAAVCGWNLSAALPMILRPTDMAGSFAVAACGRGGMIMVQGLGVAFLMWQVPFVPTVWDPRHNRVTFLCLIVMQMVGLAGETLMLASLSEGSPALRATGLRFVAFDGAGLILLIVGYLAVHPITAALAALSGLGAVRGG